MRRTWIPCLALLALPLAAEEPAPKARVRLVAEATAAVPGSSLELGVAFRVDPGWHVYWRAPGDSGAPTRVELSLPPELEQAGPIRWPRPERMVIPGDLVNHVYEGEALLLLPIRVKPDAAPDGKPRRLSARVDWLVCDEDRCLAEGATVELDLPIAAVAAPGPEAAAFARARATLPRPAEAGEVQASWSGTTLRLAVADARRLTFFPCEPEHHPPPLLGATADGPELALEYPAAALKERVSGHLVVALEGRELDLWIETPGPEQDAR